MRKIQFRVWEKFDKKMHYADVSHFASLLDNGVLSTVSGFGGDNIAMQFTGLKDKNGIQIYEGDILQAAESIVRIQYSGRGYEGIYLNKSQLIQSPLHNNNYLYWEVIGNIHKNPELLQ